MKRIFTILLGVGALLAAQLAFCLGNTSYTQAEELTPQEATTLAFLWENEKHLRDIFLRAIECSDNPEVASGAIVEQEHMDILKDLLNLFGLEVPVPGEEVGVFTDSYYIMPWTGYGWVCVPLDDPDGFIFLNALVYVESAIWNLMQAMEQTDKQALLDVYDTLLVESCENLRLFASLRTAGWKEPWFLSQELLDEILAGTFPVSSSGGFEINAGLNDAWYYPGTDGQGFFVSVFPELGTVSVAWFTYDTDLPDETASANLGDPGQRWLIAHGPYGGNEAVLEITSHSGGLFDTSPPEPEGLVIGSAVLRFEGCNTGSFVYELPSISRSGVVPIERVATDNVPVCEAYGQQQASTQ